MMRPEAKSMRLTDDGVLVEGSKGFVLLKKEAEAITATALGRRPRKTLGYAEKLRDEVLQRARQHRPPWSTRSDGSLRIHDHHAFYEQSFNPTLRCLETIQQWLAPNETP